MWICDQARHALRRTRAPNHAHPLHSPTLPLRIRRQLLQPLIKRPLDGPLCHAQITRAQPLVKASNTLFPHDFLDHVP